MKVYVVFVAVSSEPCRGDRRYLGTPKGSMVPEAARHPTILGQCALAGLVVSGEGTRGHQALDHIRSFALVTSPAPHRY